MRILYSHYLDDDDHPAARMTRSIAAELRAIGHEVHIYASRFGAADSPEAKASVRKFSRLRGVLWFAKTMRRDRRRDRADLDAVRKFSPDVVLARQDAYRASMRRAARRAGVPLVTYADAPVAHEVRTFGRGPRWHPPGVVEWIERATLKASRRVVTVSAPSAEILRRYWLDVPIDAIPNGVDPSRFGVMTIEERLARRRALGISEPIVIGFQGTFKPFHGVERLGEMIRSTADRPDVRWLIVGDGPGLPALREAVGVDSRCTFLGRRPPEEMGSLLSLIDVAVAPHELASGPFYFCPLKILEYAAAGCAIVASDQGDIPAMLDDGNAAVLLRDDQLSTWTGALGELLDDPARRASLGASAREFALSHRTWRTTAEGVARACCSAVRETAT